MGRVSLARGSVRSVPVWLSIALILGACSSESVPTEYAVSIDFPSLDDVPGDVQDDGYEGCLEDFDLCASGALPEDASIPEDEFAQEESHSDYLPNVITVRVGDSVLWTNNDSVGHTVKAVDGSFDSTTIFVGGTWTHQFDTPGEFEYFCVPHPWMRAKVVVEP